MIPALYILGFTVLVGLLLYIGELHWRKQHKSDQSDQSDQSDLSDQSDKSDEPDRSDRSDRSEESDQSDREECCGLHLVCEKDSLSPMSDEIIYYDDEELDRFIGRTADSYTAEETEEFRDVLMTLRPEDVAGWARSVTQRRLELPSDVRDELLILVNEMRLTNRNTF